ncbi:MAG TPA: efflux RND transporter permease subunit [Sphingomonas sp.]
MNFGPGGHANNFIDRGRVKRVFVQADEPYRRAPENLGDLYAPSATDEPASFDAFATLSRTNAPMRWNHSPPPRDRCAR